jgi:hypothetical protein
MSDEPEVINAKQREQLVAAFESTGMGREAAEQFTALHTTTLTGAAGETAAVTVGETADRTPRTAHDGPVGAPAGVYAGAGPRPRARGETAATAHTHGDGARVGGPPAGALVDEPDEPDAAPDSAPGADSGAGEPGRLAGLAAGVAVWSRARRRAVRAVEWVVGEWTPPAVWSQRPASLAELVGYARHGAWTAHSGFWRTAGVWWMGLVVVPFSTLAYYAAWVLQRPSRFLVCGLVYVVVAHTGLGAAVLPWPAWLP